VFCHVEKRVPGSPVVEYAGGLGYSTDGGRPAVARAQLSRVLDDAGQHRVGAWFKRRSGCRRSLGEPQPVRGVLDGLLVPAGVQAQRRVVELGFAGAASCSRVAMRADGGVG
jgi:hypothetical protein